MRNKKRLFPLLIIGLLIIVMAILELTHVTNFVRENPAKPSNSQGPTVEEKKQEDAVNAEIKKQVVESDDSQSSPNTPSKNIDITARQESNGTVTVVAKLTGYSSGSCSLKVTNGADTASFNADIIYQTEFSTCAGFSVPVSTVGKGDWTLRLDVTSDGSTESKTINIGVN